MRNAVSMKLRKEKAGYYSSQLCENQDSRVNFENLTRAFTNKKQHKTSNAPAFENLTAASFNEIFTSVAEKLYVVITKVKP